LDNDDHTAGFVPDITYDLFATVNHFGSMQSGHYVSNIKVDDMWYHCNDASVYHAGVGNGAAEVLSSQGAYMLFYIRREVVPPMM
jgi:ubiquitin carboxyl-terminal hydrolase 22/27/51